MFSWEKTLRMPSYRPLAPVKTHDNNTYVHDNYNSNYNIYKSNNKRLTSLDNTNLHIKGINYLNFMNENNE